MDKEKAKRPQKVSVYLDRIEELEDETTEAVLYFGDDEEEEMREFVLPGDFLPEDASEGDYLKIEISVDSEKTENALNEARELQAENED